MFGASHDLIQLFEQLNLLIDQQFQVTDDVDSFSGGGYFERVAYAEQPKTITVFVASAEKEDDLTSSEKAFRDLVASYLFISDDVTTPKHE